MAGATNSTPAAPPPKTKSSAGAAVGAIIIVLLLIVAGLYFLKLGPFAPAKSPAAPLDEGGFTQGQVVTFTYNGTDTYLCTPGISVMFPNNATATTAGAKTACEVGNASQSAVKDQLPEWVLVPAFAGLSVFGVTALGASSDGYPTVNGTPILTDCGAGGSTAACVDHPTYMYSPFFTTVEQRIGQPSGYGGLPLGVLPTPSHDHVINTSSTWPNIPWGTIAVLVLDPNILPNRATGQCTVTVPSNLTGPIANCLTSLEAIDRAAVTCSSAVVHFNSAAKNPIWTTLNQLTASTVCAQLVVPGDLTIPQINGNLDSNLYIPFSVAPGAPPSFPK